MDLVGLISDIVLAVFTIVLAGASIGLWRSTNRYTKATKEMAQSTEKYVEISEKQLKMDQVNYIHSVHHSVFIEEPALKKQVTLEDVGDLRDSDSAEERERKRNEVKKKLRRAYGEITRKILDDVLKEMSDDSAGES